MFYLTTIERRKNAKLLNELNKHQNDMMMTYFVLGLCVGTPLGMFVMALVHRFGS